MKRRWSCSGEESERRYFVEESVRGGTLLKSERGYFVEESERRYFVL